MKTQTLGVQELSLLRYVSESAPVSVGEICAGFGESAGLARSTIETVLERLRKKGYLTRRLREGVYCYEPTLAQQELMAGLVEQFVERTLAGSLVPFVTYFSRQNQLTDAELSELERLVAKLESATRSPS